MPPPVLVQSSQSLAMVLDLHLSLTSSSFLKHQLTLSGLWLLLTISPATTFPSYQHLTPDVQQLSSDWSPPGILVTELFC